MAEPKPKGPWINRFATRFFALLLGILIFWLLGFLVEDIKQIRGPDWDEVEARHIDATLLDRQAELAGQLRALDREIGNATEEQRIVGDSSRNLQTTIGQLLELQKLSIEKDIALSETEQENLSVSLQRFLADQDRYQALNQRVSELTGEKRSVEDEARTVERQLAEQREPAREEFDRLREKHRLKLASLQLAVLVPLLLVGAYVFLKYRGSVYMPMILAFAGATLVKVALVLHEYFPRRYFRYILILFLLVVVVRVLMHFIRTVAFPKAPWLEKQYREAYERFFCPICEFPIRTGPRRFLFWTRRTVKRNPPRGSESEEPYTCPSCGTALFAACPACGKIRHALLTHCQHCGAHAEGVVASDG